MVVLLIDSYSLLFRAYHALPAMNTSRGVPTQALYGFAQSLLKLLREERPTQVAFARDLPAPTFRHASYPAYKSGRPKAPSDLVSQLNALETLTRAFGVEPACAEGYEADDVLATLARTLERGDARVIVVSGDRDLLQLVSPRINVEFVGARGQKPVRYDEARVVERFGFPPTRLPLYSALLGEVADNLPKIPGVGAATARTLVAAHEDAESLLAALPRLSPRVAATLGSHAEQLRATEALARLKSDVPLDTEAALGRVDAAALVRLANVLEGWEFESLRTRVVSLAATLERRESHRRPPAS